jgi:hypothetical protein
MGNRHVLRPGNEHRLAMPEWPTGRSGAHFASAATMARMAQEVTIPNIPVARRPPRRQRTLVRPYVRTGGRTQSTRNLAIEAMVSVHTDVSRNRPGINGEFRGIEYQGPEIRNVEYHSVLAVCRRPKSVAEVAAALSVPLGVAKVLLGDMAELGLVIVHDTSADGDGRPALELMERILNGLRRL